MVQGGSICRERGIVIVFSLLFLSTYFRLGTLFQLVMPQFTSCRPAIFVHQPTSYSSNIRALADFLPQEFSYLTSVLARFPSISCGLVSRHHLRLSVTSSTYGSSRKRQRDLHRVYRWRQKQLYQLSFLFSHAFPQSFFGKIVQLAGQAALFQQALRSS